MDNTEKNATMWEVQCLLEHVATVSNLNTRRSQEQFPLRKRCLSCNLRAKIEERKHFPGRKSKSTQQVVRVGTVMKG